MQARCHVKTWQLSYIFPAEGNSSVLVCLYVCVRARVRTRVHVYVCVYMCVCVCVDIYVDVYNSLCKLVDRFASSTLLLTMP